MRWQRVAIYAMQSKLKKIGSRFCQRIGEPRSSLTRNANVDRPCLSEQVRISRGKARALNIGTVVAETSSQRHSRMYRVTAWISAVVIISLGIYLSHIRFHDSEWLSRAGCLVVMLGIWSGIGGVFQERLLFRGSKWRRRNALTAAKARLFELETGPEETEKKLAEINEAYDHQMAEAAQSLRISIGMLEVSLLMTGTFLWGFGDLII